MKKGCLISVVAVLVILLAGAVFIVGIRWSRDRARSRWDREAIGTISALAADTNWVALQISVLQSQPLEEDSSRSGWMSDNLILLKSGAWLIYTNACQKENWRLRDMFIAKASDGRWYYTTFHFCRRMLVLPMMGRPADMQFFQKEYALREFDGSPEADLKKKWPHPD